MKLNRKDLDKIIIKILKEVTALPKISVKSDINDLYIDSITWVQIIEKIEEKIGKFSDLEAFFTESLSVNTVKEMIDLIDLHMSKN
ncbi:UNVERIFIED_CONTAM: phosphopantetheine binding protein [Acetivibrio alkalicellulosi]